MKPEEWAPIAKRMVSRWFHVEIPPHAIDQYLEDLADLPAEHVSTALDVLSREGREFPPPAGVIRQRIVELSTALPDFDEVLLEMSAMLKRATRQRQGSYSPSTGMHYFVQPAEEWSCPEVHAFATEIGYREFSRAEYEGDTTWRAQARDRWKAICRRVKQGELLVGIESHGLRGIERYREPAAIGNAVDAVLKQLRPAEAAEGYKRPA